MCICSYSMPKSVSLDAMEFPCLHPVSHEELVSVVTFAYVASIDCSLMTCRLAAED